MPEAHSRFSASRFEQRMLCPGSEAMERGKPDSSSVYADEGTAAHTLAAWCLDETKDAVAYLGRNIEVGERTFVVDEDMAAHVQTYVNSIREYAKHADVMLVERKVNYSDALGCAPDDGWGTSDTIVMTGRELQSHDLKYGRGNAVEAEDNVQLKLYGLGALAEIEALGETADMVRLVIHQPRLQAAPKEWTLSVDELRAFGSVASKARQRVEEATEAYPSADWHDTYTTAGEKQCRYCKAKATCPTLRASVAETVARDGAAATPEEFADLVLNAPTESSGDNGARWLSACLAKVDMIEDWCKAVRAETERRLLAGDDVPGYKLVQGRRGDRSWSDAAEAEKMLKTFRLKTDEMYKLSLISPTTAEKLHKAETIGKRQWPKLAELIVQPDGKLHVAPVSDKREAVKVTPVVDDFADMSTSVDDLA